MKITKTKLHYHCCDCGSVSAEFDEIQHARVCQEIAREQNWKKPCSECKDHELVMKRLAENPVTRGH